MILKKDLVGIQNLIESKYLKFIFHLKNNIAFKPKQDLLKDLLSTIDCKGNSPVLLCIILHQNKKDSIFIKILSLLLENGAKFKLKDKNKWTPLSIAISYGDKVITEMLYRYYLKRREEKLKSKAILIADYFKKMKDFYVELKWKVKIPLLSWLCPNDIFKITKFGANVRADYTFVDYKRLLVIRKPLSVYLKVKEDSNDIEFFRLDREKKEYYDPFENLDEEEIQLVLKDIMNKNRMNGSFKILECKLEENKSFFDKNKNVFDEVHGFMAQKYSLNLSVQFDKNPTHIIEYVDLDENNYLNEGIEIIKSRRAFDDKDIDKTLQEGLHIKNDTVLKGIKELEKEKKMKATVWVVQNSPINSQDAVNLLESIASANEFMEKVLEFFHHPDIQKIIDNNGFPIKIEIPYNIFIDLTFSFDKYIEINKDDPKAINLLGPLNEANQRSRKEIQDIKTNYKIRAGYTNIR